MNLQQRLEQYFTSLSDAFCEDLESLIRINSVCAPAQSNYPFGEGPAKALAQALAIAEKMGFTPENRENIVGLVDLGPEEAGLDILAHLDIVPPSDGWTKTEPFVMKKEGDRLYGRGTADDKGPALAALYALKAVKDLNIPLKKRVRLLLGTNEETGSADLSYYYALEKEAPMSFSPDADFPVINVEKGGYHETISREFEENELIPRILGAQAGFVINAVPEKASFEIEGLNKEALLPYCEKNAEETHTQFTIEETEFGYLVTILGTSAHASTPEMGNNALTAMLALFARLPLSPGIGHTMLKTLHSLFPHGDWEGKALGVKMEDAVSGKLTLTADLFTYTPGSVSLSFDSRVPICGNTLNVQNVLLKKFSAARLQMTGSPMRPAHHVDADSAFVKTLLSCYTQVTGKEGKCMAIGGGTYVHNLKNGVAFGCADLDVDNRMHGADEFVLLSQLKKSAIIFAMAIIELCS